MRPAAKGKPLAMVRKPPARTLAMVGSGMAHSGDSYRITFRPYGNGPSGAVVVQVVSSEPVRRTQKPLELSGRNALVRLAAGSKVTAGGLYAGTIELVKNGDTFVLVLRHVTRTN